MVAIYKLVFLATSATALIAKRDFTTVFNDLKTVNSDTTKLDSAIKAFTGSNLAPVASAESQLETDIKQTTKDTNAASTATAAQASQVLSYVQGTLIPNIKTTLNDLVSKKSAFTSAGAKAIVQSDLGNLKSESAALGAALIKKAPAAYTSSASVASSSIVSLLNSASLAYA